MLSMGSVEYTDTGGGPVVVLLHGLVMDGSLWRNVVRELGDEYRCVVPTVGERPERVARLVLVSCEAFDNCPPGLPGRTVAFAARLPGGLNALIQPLRLRVLRRLPFAFGWMAKRPIPHTITDAWLRPVLTQRAIRRDLTRYLRAIDKRDMLAAAERLPSFDRPSLVIWAADDRVMPREHGRRLAALLPQGRLIEIPDSYTYIPEDQPGELARAIRQFVRDTSE
jgi:pimeloyl-ACP methyl ester carboxylesterase